VLVCASLNRFNTMREWLPIPSAASAITLRQAAHNATGLYNCFFHPRFLKYSMHSAHCQRSR
jgi:hypothetical protein